MPALQLQAILSQAAVTYACTLMECGVMGFVTVVVNLAITALLVKDTCCPAPVYTLTPMRVLLQLIQC